MTRVLVVQFGRAGDILMTGPVLRGVKRAYPSAEVSLMVLDTFAQTPLPSSLHDRRLLFPLGELAHTLASPEQSWEVAREQLQRFLRDACPATVDLVVNVSHSDLSALVTTLVPARRRVGAVVRPDRRQAIDSPWLTYVRATARSKAMAGFHVADVWAWAAGVARDDHGLEITVTDTERAWASHWIDGHGLNDRPLIAMQLGASMVAKQWPAERFAALADALPGDLGDIVIVGAPHERALTARYLSAVHRPVWDSTGESSLGQLAALLARCEVLVTNDTGPMHVAAAVGTRVVDLSSGPVTPDETGPYGEGHVVVEPDTACYPCALDTECHHTACRTALDASEVAAVIRYAMARGPVPHLTRGRVRQGRRVGPGGRLAFEPVDGRRTANDALRGAMTQMWEASLIVPGGADRGWPAPMEGATADGSGAAIDEWIDALARVEGLAASASTQAGRFSTLRAGQAQRCAAQVHQTLEQLLALGESTTAARPLVTFLRCELESAQAPDVAGLARVQSRAYAAVAHRAQALAGALSGELVRTGTG